MILSGMVASGGYEVVGEATTGRDAVRRFVELRPHIVIMDLILPGLNGIEATREIRRVDPSARILICSAVAQDALVADVMAAGARAFIEKPPCPAHLLRTLAQLDS
jgi:two-component system chemotaxis response regulator CheY